MSPSRREPSSFSRLVFCSSTREHVTVLLLNRMGFRPLASRSTRAGCWHRVAWDALTRGAVGDHAHPLSDGAFGGPVQPCCEKSRRRLLTLLVDEHRVHGLTRCQWLLCGRAGSPQRFDETPSTVSVPSGGFRITTGVSKWGRMVLKVRKRDKMSLESEQVFTSSTAVKTGRSQSIRS